MRPLMLAVMHPQLQDVIMINYIGLLVGLLGLLVGILGIAIGVLQQRKMVSIRNRNRAYTWGLAKESHRLMALLEQFYSALQKGAISLGSDESEKYKGLFYRSYQLSTGLVSKVGEHLVVEYNVSEEELSKVKDDKIAWGYLESAIRLSLKALENA